MSPYKIAANSKPDPRDTQHLGPLTRSASRRSPLPDAVGLVVLIGVDVELVGVGKQEVSVSVDKMAGSKLGENGR